MNILVVNDDGFESEGLALLVKAAAHFGNVYVAAPDSERSAISHAITIKGYLTVKDEKPSINMVNCISVDGTPADAVRAALRIYDFDFDLVLSGVNHGANLAKDVIYSGTIGAAYQAAIAKIPAIAFSADDVKKPYLYDELVKLLDEILESGLHEQVFVLNVNFPKETFTKSLGTKITHLGKRLHHTELVKVTEPNKYFLSGSTTLYVEDEDSDVYAYENGYVSLTPLQMDTTDYDAIKKILNQKS